MALGKGAIVGILGGIVAIVGTMLPWWQVTASAGGYISVSVPLLGIFTLGGLLVLVFGVLGLVFAALNKPVTQVVALVMGLLAAVIALVMGAFVPTVSVSIPGASGSITAGFGFWISMVGGLLLAVGGALGFVDSRKAPQAWPTQAPPPPA